MAEHELRLTPLTPEAFAPFGELLVPSTGVRLQSSFYGDAVEIYRAGAFSSDEPCEMLLNVTKRRPLEVVYFERHDRLTQVFAPLGGHAVIVVVAPHDAPLVAGVPALDTARAFLVPGNMAIQLHRGTWHEFPFPLVDGTNILVTGHRDLARGLEAERDDSGSVAGLDVIKTHVHNNLGDRLWVAAEV
jgi:ureidoglycolate lyase